MYLKKLEILGFKSFADKTALYFEPGITAVVGPNGAGKSNIFDAVRWVLGEQSVKSMRGSKMEDVIFNGTDLRAPVGFAEVNLTFSNEKKILPIDETDVTITRRLYRSGESEYSINKALVRLKDVLELFMGTGVGAESYSLVEQGKMDLILSSHPEDRRLIFDEASGITKYKSQKKEALNKLEDTEQNLLRINDIILEVKRQISSLERQATKARRYKEIFDELKQNEIKLINFQVSKINQSLNSLTGKLGGLNVSLDGAQNEVIDTERGLNEKRNGLAEFENRMNQTKDILTSLENSTKNASQHIDITRERIKELVLRLENIVKLKDELTAGLKNDEARAVEQKNQLEHTQNSFSSLKEQIEKKEALLKENLEITRNTEKNIIKEKTNILDLTTELSRLKNLLTEINVQSQNLNLRKKRLELEKNKTSQEKLSIETNYNDLNSQLKGARVRLDDLNLNKQKTKDEAINLNKDLDNLNKACQDLENQKIKLESQREFIEKLKTEYEGLEQKLNAVILVQDLPSGITGILARVNNTENLGDNLKQNFQNFNHILHCDAKPIPLETGSITNKIEAIIISIDKTKNLILEKKQLTQKFEKDIVALDNDIQSQGIEAANFTIKLEGVSQELDKLKQEEEIVIFEIEDLTNELAVLNTKNNNTHLKVNQIDESLKNSNKLINDFQLLLQEKITLREELVVSITQDKTEFQGLHDKLNSQNDALGALEVTVSNNKRALMHYVQEESDSNCKLGEFNQLVNTLTDKIKIELEKKINISNNLNVLKNDFSILNDEFRQLELKKEDFSLKIEDLKNNIHKIQMDQKTYEFQRLNLVDKIKQLYKEDITGEITEVENIDENTLSEAVNTLKNNIQRYDGASISTIEEFDELRKRYEFLLSQQNDLVKAKEAVQEAISKINRTTRKLFVETFTKIAEEFNNHFKYLFGGGQAEVFLLDENNPLDSGIEIVCRPPGKKLQNILLLSGGEKALSATALMFAIFKVKPSPFCVLDEIDASLDEANIDRFSKILLEFANESQFVVITHNKKTMSNANVMYGITMQEQGVSRIVSVKLSQNSQPEVPREEDNQQVLTAASNS